MLSLDLSLGLTNQMQCVCSIQKLAWCKPVLTSLCFLTSNADGNRSSDASLVG